MGTSNYSDEFKRDAVHPRLRKALRSNDPRGGSRCAGIRYGRYPSVWASARILCASGCNYSKNLRPKRKASSTESKTVGSSAI